MRIVGRLRAALFSFCKPAFGATASLAMIAAFSSAARADEKGSAWPEMLGDSAHSSYSSDPAITTSNASGFGVKWMANLYSTDLGSPAVAYNATLGRTVVYVGNQRADVFAVSAVTGKELWSTNLGVNDKIEDSPMVAPDGSVWVGTSENPTLYKLNGATGAVECTLKSPLAVDASPMLASPRGGVETVYWSSIDATNLNGPVFASQEASCAQNWSFDDYLNPSSAGVWATSAYGVSASGEPLVFFGSADSDSTEYAVDAVTGNRVWYYSIPSPPGDYDIGDGATVSAPGKNGFADGVVYVDSKYGYEYALDLTTGALLWQFGPFAKAGGPGSRSSAALDGTNLVFGYYVGGATGGVLALNAVSGSLLWNYLTPKEVLSSPAIVGPPGSEIVTFGDLTGVFRMLSLASGSELYAYQTGGYITSSPAEADGKIFIAGSDGFLYAFGRTGGNGSKPASTITAPAAGSQLSNPDGSLTITGTATDASGVANVEVAVQENGASGPWYDAATGSTNPGPIRNQATLTNPGSTTTNWSLTLPAPAAGGTFAAYASAVNVNNIVNPSTTSSFTILPSLGEPNVTLSATDLPPGASFTASSTAFRPREHVTFSLFGNVVATKTVSANGHVPAATVKIPTGATFGPTSLTLTGLTSGKTTSGTIYVTNNWVEFGHDSAHSALEVHDSVIDESLSIGNGTVLSKSWYYVANAAVNSSPSVVNGISYFGNDAGVVSAVVVNTGASKWAYSTPSGAPIRSAPAIDPSGTVIVASTDGNLYWIGNTGSLLKSISLGGTLTSPNVDNGQIFVASSTGELYDVSDSTGSVTWSSALSAASASAPAFDATSNIVIAGDGSGAVTAFNATTGAQLWKVTTDGAVTAAPLIVNGTVYIGSADTNFYAINETTGAVNWKYALTGPIVAAASQLSTSQISIGDSNAMAYAFSTSGALAYSYSLGQKSGPIVGIANVLGGTFFEMAGGLVAMIRVVDKPGDAWHYQTATTLSTSPAIVDGTVYIGAADGGLYAFTPQGANPLAKSQAPVISITDSNWVCTTP
jgi:outer membrane protein assembly factor BamB